MTKEVRRSVSLLKTTSRRAAFLIGIFFFITLFGTLSGLSYVIAGNSGDILIQPTTLFVNEMAYTQAVDTLGIGAFGPSARVAWGAGQNLELRSDLGFANISTALSNSASYQVVESVKYRLLGSAYDFGLAIMGIVGAIQTAGNSASGIYGVKLPVSTFLGSLLFTLTPRIVTQAGTTTYGSDLGFLLPVWGSWLNVILEGSISSVNSLATTAVTGGFYIQPTQRTTIGIILLTKDANNYFTVGLLNVMGTIGLSL